MRRASVGKRCRIQICEDAYKNVSAEPPCSELHPVSMELSWEADGLSGLSHCTNFR